MYWCDGPARGLAFASEVRALVRAGLTSGAPDPEGLGTYQTWGSVHGPTTVFEGVREVMPGTYVEWTPEGVRVVRWWTPRVQPEASAAADATRLLKETLFDAVTVTSSPIGRSGSSSREGWTLAR
jgi:asparagine synthase (glutamine-hydrolysing)